MSIEKSLEANFYRRVKAKGGWALKLWPVGVVGLPDRMALLPGGKIFFVEFKDTGKKPTPKQDAVMQQLEDLGFPCHVVDNTESLNKICDDL